MKRYGADMVRRLLIAAAFAAVIGGWTAAAAQQTAAEALQPAAEAPLGEDAARSSQPAPGPRIKKSAAIIAQTATPAVPGGLSRTFKSVLTFVSLLLAGVYIHQRLRGRSQPAPGSQAIEVVARHALSARAALIILRAEDKKFLLSQSGDEVKLLAELEPADDFQERLVSLALAEQEEDMKAAGVLAANS